MENHQLINQTSGDTEYFTPSPILEAARELMGGIELDPASSEIANQWVKADRFFTKEIDGLKQDWVCDSLFLNHPFGRVSNPLWIKKLISEYEKGNFTEGCCLTYAATSESWFRPLLSHTQCFLIPRTNYYLPDGSLKRGVTKGSVVTYFGERDFDFYRCFKELGVVKVAFEHQKS